MGVRQFVEALQWLAYIGRTRNIVTHAGNGREVHLPGVPNVKVDGYCLETNEVFKYLGCFWHGCPACMPYRDRPIGNTTETLQSMYEGTMTRLQQIKDVDYIVSVRGCEFRILLLQNSGLECQLSSHPYVKNSPINIRDALCGGKTEVTKTYYSVEQGEEIRYVNVISLYPYICKYGKYLVGLPKVYVGADCPPGGLERGL